MLRTNELKVWFLSEHLVDVPFIDRDGLMAVVKPVQHLKEPNKFVDCRQTGVIRKPAAGDCSDGFRSCLTRFQCSWFGSTQSYLLAAGLRRALEPTCPSFQSYEPAE